MEDPQFSPLMRIIDFVDIKCLIKVIPLVCKSFNKCHILNLKNRRIDWIEFSKNFQPSRTLISKFINLNVFHNIPFSLLEYCLDKSFSSCIVALFDQKKKFIEVERMKKFLKQNKFYIIRKSVEKENTELISFLLNRMKKLKIEWNVKTIFPFYHPVYLATKHKKYGIVKIFLDGEFHRDWNVFYFHSIYLCCETGDFRILELFLNDKNFRSEVPDNIINEDYDEEEKKSISCAFKFLDDEEEMEGEEYCDNNNNNNNFDIFHKFQESDSIFLFPSCFEISCKNRHEKILEILISHKDYSPSQRDITMCLESGLHRIFELMLDSGQVNFPLSYNRNYIIKEIIEQEIDHRILLKVLEIGKDDIDFTYVIPYAVKKNDVDFTRYLIHNHTKKIDLTAYGNSLLDWSLKNKYQDISIFILQNIQQFNSYGIFEDEFGGKKLTTWEKIMTVENNHVSLYNEENEDLKLLDEFYEIEIKSFEDLNFHLKSLMNEIDRNSNWLEVKMKELIKEIRFKDDSTISLRISKFLINEMRKRDVEKTKKINTLEEKVEELNTENQELKKRMLILEKKFENFLKK